MARAIGKTPEDAAADNLDKLSRYLKGNVGLIFTNRDPAALLEYLGSLSAVDFARAGNVAPRSFTIPAGIVYSTGGEVPAEHDVPMGHTIEPELRRLNVPTRMDKGKVRLGEDGGEGYTVCKEGDVLDSRQTRLLKLFSVCMSEFTVQVKAYWSASSTEITVVDGDKDEEEMEDDEE